MRSPWSWLVVLCTGEASQAVTVPASSAVDVAVTLDASKWKRARHKNKFGRDYEAGERY